MNTEKELLTAHDIDRMYKEVEAKYPKVTRYIKARERFKRNIYKR